MIKSESEWVFDYSELRRKYPRVYEKDIRCGFYIPSDWLPIVDSLSARIESHLSLHPEIDFSVDQVKEKFWGLRFYVSGSDEVIDQYIDEAEASVKELVDASRVS